MNRLVENISTWRPAPFKALRNDTFCIFKNVSVTMDIKHYSLKIVYGIAFELCRSNLKYSTTPTVA